MTHPLLEKLAGGDRRSIGRSEEVTAVVLDDPSLFGVLFEGMLHADPLVRMRAADVAEKVTIQNPAWLAPYKARLLAEVGPIEQQEVRWHVAQMIPRLELDGADRETAVALLFTYLDDASKIVKTEAMTTLVHLARDDEALRSKLISLLKVWLENGSPAMRSRSRRLLKQIS